MTLAAAASYIGLFGLLMWQAFRAQSITRPDELTITLLALWAVLTVAALCMAFYRTNSIRAHAVAY